MDVEPWSRYRDVVAEELDADVWGVVSQSAIELEALGEGMRTAPGFDDQKPMTLSEQHIQRLVGIRIKGIQRFGHGRRLGDAPFARSLGRLMQTLLAKGLFRIARASRTASYLLGGLTALGLLTAPFVAVRFGDWLMTSGIFVGIAVATWLILFNGLPMLLARGGMALLPDDQMDFAHAELAIWAYEGRHGHAGADLRREFHASSARRRTSRDATVQGWERLTPPDSGASN